MRLPQKLEFLLEPRTKEKKMKIHIHVHIWGQTKEGVFVATTQRKDCIADDEIHFLSLSLFLSLVGKCWIILLVSTAENFILHRARKLRYANKHGEEQRWYVQQSINEIHVADEDEEAGKGFLRIGWDFSFSFLESFHFLLVSWN